MQGDPNAWPERLGPIADPFEDVLPIDVDGVDAEETTAMLRGMVVIREAERLLGGMRRDKEIGGPVHLGVGQEAVAVGVSRTLTSSDRVFGAHRSHSHVLALGAPLRALFAEILGRDTGLSRGMGGSMHLWDEPRGFYGSVPIVAGTVPLAVGAAFAARYQGTRHVGVSYLGDGAMEEGATQESLNLARMLDAPVLFVVENNFFSSHMHIDLRQPSDRMARFAAAHGIPWRVVDGNDCVAVAKAAREMVAAARDGEGPGLLEAVTYRWYGHVDWREDIDVGVARSAKHLARWRERDPIARLLAAMIEAGHLDEAGYRALVEEVESDVEAAWAQAAEDPYPDADALLGRVFPDRRDV